MKKVRKLLTISMLALAVSWQAGYAQVTTSSVSGRVTDGNEVLIGATVKATHEPSGTVYGVVTRPDGSYNVLNMRIGGPYTIEVSYVGFQPSSFSNIHLTLGEEFTLNVSLSEDATLLGEVVVVATQSSVMSANRTGAQEIVTRERMDKLPTLNRSLSDFTKLTPMNSGGNFGGISSRFNNTTVDGAIFNSGFGTGGASVEIISLEALEQIQVMLAPYDVRNGGFTGAGINSVTKSGSNEFKASAYTYVKSPDLIGYRVKDNIQSVSEFSNRQYGVSFSGAFIKNKLFYFINAEIDRQESPIVYTTKNSQTNAGVLQDLSDFLKRELNYDPGYFDKTKRETMGDRLTARLDWNLNTKNVLSLKYNYLKSFSTFNPSTSGAPLNGRGPNQYAIPFSSSFYRGNYNSNIIIADLNSTINNRMSNYLKVGFSSIREFRDMDGGFFPQVDILNGGSPLQAMTTFGTEANSYNNQISTDIFQLQNNFVIDLPKHQITIGTQSSYRAVSNGFAQNYPGAWVFSSVDDFKFNVMATKHWLANNGGNMSGFDIREYDPTAYGFASTVTGITNTAGTGLASYQKKYALGNEFPFSKVNVIELGFYVQDKWKINDKLNITLGLRVDMPIFTTELPVNDRVAAETYRDGIKVDVSKYPNANPVFSPRLGFNYKPFEDNSLQIRGGTGIFAGTPPYVWLCNQMGNNGVLFGDLFVSGVNNLATLGFTGNVDEYKPASGAATRADIAVADPNFKYPNLWKSNLAADYRFGNGWVITAELLYSKDLNGIYHDNIGLEMTDRFVNDGSGQNKRPAFTRAFYSSAANNQNAANHVVMMRNTNKGHSVFGSLQIQKNFQYGPLQGLYVNASYTKGKAMSVTDGTSSVATSAWRYRPALDPNAQELGFNSGSVNNRLLASVFYTANWSKNAATNIGFIYQGYNPFRYTYCYNGDANSDLFADNDLIYIPRSLDEVRGHLVAGDFGSVEEAWAAMDAFIAQDPYLKNRRGQFAERNGAVAPWTNQLDFSLYHDIKVHQNNKRFHTLRFSLDIANFLNLLNKNWGVQQTTVLGNQQYQFLRVTQAPNAGNNYTLQYSMLKDNGGKPFTETFQDNIGTVSRWQAVIGVKYIF